MPMYGAQQSKSKVMHIPPNGLYICFIYHTIIIQWQLSKTTTHGPILTDLYREVAALHKWTAMLYNGGSKISKGGVLK